MQRMHTHPSPHLPTVRAWDARPFVHGGDSERALRAFVGARNSFEQSLLRCAWSPDGFRAAAGSADRLAYVWDYESGAVKYALPGHTGEEGAGREEGVGVWPQTACLPAAGIVHEVAWHPTEPIIASASADKKVFLGEIEPAF